MRRARILLALGAAVLTACVGPAPSFGAYEGKAGATADSMRSVVETARLGIQVAITGKSFAPYLYEVMHYAEDDATSIQGTFDSIQPPGGASSDVLRKQLDDLLTQSVDTITDLRIAARRGDVDQLPAIGAPLGRLSEQLDRFSLAHPSGGG
jgi:hypothetical protein